jgi:hypothetical protein
MPASPFTVTPTPPTSLRLAPGEEGKLSFTVTCLSAPDKTYEVMLQALLSGDDGKGKEVDWLVAGPQRTLSMAGGKTETVTITARPTATSPRGQNTIKLAIADKDHPNDTFAYSAPVVCDVVVLPGPARPPTKRPPWWLIAAIAGGVLLLGGGSLLAWKLTREEPGKPGEPCASDPASACEAGLLCAPGTHKCLLAAGAACTQGDLCVSGECDSKHGVCTTTFGLTCNLGDKDPVPCPEHNTCDPTTKTCLGNVGTACKTDAQCETGTCDATTSTCIAPNYAWHTLPFEACDAAACSPGTQSRRVWCERSDGTHVEDALCTTARPAQSQSCNNTNGCSWYASDYGACSARCGGGTQTRSVYCRDGVGAHVPSAWCAGTPPTSSASCNTLACTWYASPYGACSARCGGGTQTRSVYCRDGAGAQAPNGLCSGAAPTASVSCNTFACVVYVVEPSASIGQCRPFPLCLGSPAFAACPAGYRPTRSESACGNPRSCGSNWALCTFFRVKHYGCTNTDVMRVASRECTHQ